MKKNKIRGEEAFNTYYSSVYGERWISIRESFRKEPDYLELKEGLISPYYIDSASIYPVLALEIVPGNKILDMCAAPGGKTLLMALANGSSGSITSNDRSPDRRNRLLKVIGECLPEELRETVKITGHDASRWGIYEKNTYDRVLLDAPCSSERHVFLSGPHLEIWSPARTRQLAERQFAMLAAALDAAKPGGRIVYSTCSVSPAENDSNMERLLKKRKGLFAVAGIENITAGIKGLEKTEFGFQIMPDKENGAGPIYFSVINKF